MDDHRVIGGIVHVLKSGGRWVDAPPVYGPRKTLYNRFVRWAEKGVWTNIFHPLAAAGGPAPQLLIDSSAVTAHRSALSGKGGRSVRRLVVRAVGAKENPPLADHLCRPVAFLLTGGHVADCIAAGALLDQMPVTDILTRDKGYDSDAVRRKIERKGVAPNIPPKANRRWKNCFSRTLYRDRNAIERMF